MMIHQAESIGVGWTRRAAALRGRDWQSDFAGVAVADFEYPEYYLRPFHAYDRGNLCWEAAFEVEVAALAVHARIWPESGARGDARLRQRFHEVLSRHLDSPPVDVLDLGCSVGMSTEALQRAYPNARLTGIDLSPHFLAVARHRARSCNLSVRWLHGAAEATGLPAGSFDLVSAFLVFHELPEAAAIGILAEARRLLRPGGHFCLMDMNPRSEVYKKMPTYVLTLLKSTEPYLDEYFAFDLEAAIVAAGFEKPDCVATSARHRAIVARRPDVEGQDAPL